MGLLQAGKQLEIATGGHVMCGFHEVVVCDDTIKAINKAKDAKRILWGVSSTLFAHMESDAKLKPLMNEKGTLYEKLTKEEKATVDKKYPEIYAGDQVNEELKK